MTVCLVFALAAGTGALRAQSGSRGPFDATPQRPTFTADTTTTAPGTLELESGLDAGEGFFTLPLTFKFTPGVRSGLFHTTEFSVSFEGVQSLSAGGMRETRFGDEIAFTIRRPVYTGSSFSLAVAPRSSFALRGDPGARLGLIGLAAYVFGDSSLVYNFTWTAATRSTPGNPARLYENAATYTRNMRAWSLFAGFLVQNPTGGSAAVSLGQGLSYRLRSNWVVDLAVRQDGLADGDFGFAIASGITVNLGRPGDW